MTQETMDLAVFAPIKSTLAELEKKDKSLVFDHTTTDGERELRSWVKRLRGYKGDVARTHKDVKANALAFGRQVDAIKNELTAGADKIITERMKPLDEIEAKKRAEAEAIIEAEWIAKEKAEDERLADLERREAEANRKEAEFKEKERIAREKQIADEAAENARRFAEEKAEREKQEAVEAEQEKARKLEVERVANENEARAKANRLAKIEADRISNKNHRRQVEQGIIDAIVIMLGSVSDADAQSIVDAIVQGEIPNVTINY